MMNLIFSYSVEEDRRLAEAGFTFLGAAKDNKKVEVHVFQLLNLEVANAEGGAKALDQATDKASRLVKHQVKFVYPNYNGCGYVRS
jgi:type II restriction/modification system DNA methylase subunit YeeA